MCFDTKSWVAAGSKAILSLRCLPAASVFLNVYFNYRSLCLFPVANKIYIYLYCQAKHQNKLEKKHISVFLPEEQNRKR